MVDVFLDEKFIGTCDNGKEFAKKVIDERRQGRIPNEINI